jgi:hypothetical protein
MDNVVAGTPGMFGVIFKFRGNMQNVSNLRALIFGEKFYTENLSVGTPFFANLRCAIDSFFPALYLKIRPSAISLQAIFGDLYDCRGEKMFDEFGNFYKNG